MKRTDLRQVRRATAKAVAAPARQAMLAVLAGLAFLAAAIAVAPHAGAQVLSSTPYVAPPDPAVEQLRNRVEQLESDLRRATDRTEVLGAQLSDARRTAEEANAGRKKAEADLAMLSARVQALEDMVTDGKNAGTAPTSFRAAEATVNLTAPAQGASGAAVDLSLLPQDEEGFFKEAQTLLLDGKYPSAQEAFTTFLAKYGKSSKAADAQYYLGESLLYQDNYSEAAGAYGKLIKQYPNASKGPDGLVKLARSLRLMDKPTDACKTLDLMSKQFPKASAAAKQLASTERQRANCK